MFDFSYSEEQLAVKKMVRKFVDKEIIPHIQEWDAKQHFETSLLTKLADLGLMGVCIPEKYGGQGMGYNTLSIVCDDLARVDTACRTACSVLTVLLLLSHMQSVH